MRKTLLFLVVLFLPVVAFAQGACPSGVPAGVKSCFFISTATGSDSNSGASESSPWAHIPSGPDCTGNCGSWASAHNLGSAAGVGFILRGGDTWTAADLGFNISWAGSSGSPFYIGVDQSWYNSTACGTSWCRPVFNCQQTTCSQVTGGAVFWIYGDWVIFDNVEITGFKDGTNGYNIVETAGDNDTVENLYIHGWSRGSGTANSYCISDNGASGKGLGAVFSHNVIDGADSPNKDFMGGILHGYIVEDNVIRYVYNGMNGAFNDIHGNLVEYNYVAASGDHCNMVFPQNTFSGHTIWIYNNVIRYKTCGTTLFTLANSQDTSSVAYQYNNVVYDNASGNDGIGSGGHYPTGTYYDYNNTVQSSVNCFGNGESGTSSTTYFGNNHCIAPTVCVNTGTTCVDAGGNLQQTLSQANAAGYTDTETYAFSPTSTSGPTVGTGVNQASMCSGNLQALCSDTTYPTYDTKNHTVVMRAVHARPPAGNGNWDIGAYEYASSQTSAPQAPTNLQAAVN